MDITGFQTLSGRVGFTVDSLVLVVFVFFFVEFYKLHQDFCSQGDFPSLLSMVFFVSVFMCILNRFNSFPLSLFFGALILFSCLKFCFF